MKILWLSPRFPWPPVDGARQATWHLLKELGPAWQDLSRDRLKLDLVSFRDLEEVAQEHELLERLALGQTLFLEKTVTSKGQLSRFLETRLRSFSRPVTMMPFSGRAQLAKFRAWCADQTWDLTVLDGLHGAELIKSFSSSERVAFGEIVYRAHNVESELWRQASERSPNVLKKAALNFERRLYFNLERDVSRLAGSVLTVSDLDRDRFKALYAPKHVATLPIGLTMPETSAPSFDGDQIRLLFVGRLDWDPNKKGLIWFLQNVWPSLTQTTGRRFQLQIIGSGKTSELEKSIGRAKNETAGASCLEFIGRVESLTPYLNCAHLTLIPLFQGSGTRVKAIESGSFARSFVSTGLGAEGLPFTPNEDYLKAETSDEWIKVLSTVSTSKISQLSKNILSKTRAEFDDRIIAEEFFEKTLIRAL